MRYRWWRWRWRWWRGRRARLRTDRESGIAYYRARNDDHRQLQQWTERAGLRLDGWKLRGYDGSHLQHDEAEAGLGHFQRERQQFLGHRHAGANHRYLAIGLPEKRGFAHRLLAAVATLQIGVAAQSAYAYDWLQFNGDAAHSGNNAAETIIGAGNVASLTQKYQVTLRGNSDGPPVFLQGVSIPAGVKDLLFLTTTDGWTLALDAATGSEVWSHQYGANGCIATNGSACFTTSSPAIDPDRQYVYSYGLDGKVHKYRVGDGAEITSGGWPQVTTLKGQTEKGSSALATATSGGTSYLYVAHGGYPGDAGDYQGHVTAINLATGVQKVFHAACSGQTNHFALNDPSCSSTRNAIWARPGVIYDAGTDRIFVGTGNGSYNGGTTGTNWSESVLALNPDGSGASGKPIDSFTPATFQNLDNGDADLGSTAPAILPVPASSSVQHLAVQGGKDQKLRLIDLANLSGQNAPGHTGGEVQAAFNVPQGGGVPSQPAVWVNPADSSTWIFVATANGISGLKLSVTGGLPALAAQWQNAQGGTSPLVANGVLYYTGNGTVRALNPATGAQLWSGTGLGGTHWQSPIVANGVVYATGQGNKLTAFALPIAAPTFTSANSAVFQVGVASAFSVTAAGAPAPSLSESGALPAGVSFTASSGSLAGTPTVTGSFPLQFTASNGILPDAVQAFTLSVNAGPPQPGKLTYVSPSCSEFVTSGTPPNQTLTCISGGSVPVCAPSASPAAPAKGQATTISANCSNQPLANGYAWTGGTCAGSTGPTCTASRSRAGTVTYSVRAVNGAGAGPPAPISVTWH